MVVRLFSLKTTQPMAASKSRVPLGTLVDPPWKGIDESTNCVVKEHQTGERTDGIHNRSRVQCCSCLSFGV